MDEIFESWIASLLWRYRISCIGELNKNMIEAEIEEFRYSIDNEKIGILSAATHKENVLHTINKTIMQDYVFLLENLAETIGKDMHTLCLVFGIYEEPDELPICVAFHVPKSTNEKTLKEKIINARRTVLREDPTLNTEDAFERTLRDTCSSIGDGSVCCRIKIKKLRNKENFWKMAIE